MANDLHATVPVGSSYATTDGATAVTGCVLSRLGDARSASSAPTSASSVSSYRSEGARVAGIGSNRRGATAERARMPAERRRVVRTARPSSRSSQPPHPPHHRPPRPPASRDQRACPRRLQAEVIAHRGERKPRPRARLVASEPLARAVPACACVLDRAREQSGEQTLLARLRSRVVGIRAADVGGVHVSARRTSTAAWARAHPPRRPARAATATGAATAASPRCWPPRAATAT